MALTSGTLLPHSHDPWLVALSVLIAVAAAYTALEFAGRATIRRGRERAAWLFGSAFAMGTGIWSMHFTGMLAFHLPVPVFYDVPTVVASQLWRWLLPPPRCTSPAGRGSAPGRGGSAAS